MEACLRDLLHFSPSEASHALSISNEYQTSRIIYSSDVFEQTIVGMQKLLEPKIPLPCKNFASAQGCRFGSKCKFSHGDESIQKESVLASPAGQIFMMQPKLLFISLEQLRQRLDTLNLYFSMTTVIENPLLLMLPRSPSHVLIKLILYHGDIKLSPLQFLGAKLGNSKFLELFGYSKLQYALVLTLPYSMKYHLPLICIHYSSIGIGRDFRDRSADNPAFRFKMGHEVEPNEYD